MQCPGTNIKEQFEDILKQAEEVLLEVLLDHYDKALDGNRDIGSIKDEGDRLLGDESIPESVKDAHRNLLAKTDKNLSKTAEKLTGGKGKKIP